MGKGGTVLGLIGIILGAGGVGFGYFAWTGQSSNRTDITTTQSDLATILGDLTAIQGDLALRRIWYSYYTNNYHPPYLTYGVIPNISIVLDLFGPVSLHLLYVGAARCIPNPSSFSDLFFYFMIDNVRLLAPWTRVGPYEGVSSYEYSSVTLQYVIPVMASGVHNITVVVLSEDAANFVRQNTFSIVSYPV